MFFILQKETFDWDNSTQIEMLMIKDLLRQTKYLHDYIEISLDDFYTEDDIDDFDFTNYSKEKKLKDKTDFDDKFNNAVPIGTIQFVSAWLKIFKDIEKENAIEIPPILRTDEFLKRKYSIVKSQDIPRKGQYFIKNASTLKDFSYSGELEFFLYDEMFEKPKNSFDTSLRLNPNDLYQVSEIVKVLSEYRVYIIDGKIASIDFYNGDPLKLPDVELINKANMLYSTQKDYPKSYSLDVMVTPKGTAIIEIHNFTSLGLYSTIWGTDLLYAYRDGIDYLINHNTKQTEFSNFKTA